MPNDSSQHSSESFSHTLCEIEGFIDSNEFDVCLIFGDFNIDFSRDGSIKDSLCCFRSSFDLFACDLLYNIGHTYERDGGLVHSWIDHILCTQSFSNLVAEVYTLRSCGNLSDHHLLCFSLLVNCTTPPPPPSSSSSHSSYSDHILWSKVSVCQIQNYQNMVGLRLNAFPTDVMDCCLVDCSEFLEEYANHFIHTLSFCALKCLPIRSSSTQVHAGWNDGCKVSKDKADFWFKVLEEAGLLSSGTLFDIRKKPRSNTSNQSAVLNGVIIFLIREKLSNSYSERRMDGFWLVVKELVQQSKSQASAVDGITDPSDIANLFTNNINLLLKSNSPESREAMHGSIKSSLLSTHIQDARVSSEDIMETINRLKIVNLMVWALSLST